MLTLRFYHCAGRQTSCGSGNDGHIKSQSISLPGLNLTQSYVYDAMGNLAAEYPSSGSLAGSSGCGTATCYLLADHLGSTRLMTDATGNVKQRYDYLPFGEGIPASIGGRTTEMGYLTSPDAVAYVRQLFTGQYRDRESALDYFNARYYSPQQGRFVSPDPQNAGAHPSNPQTWNAYGYVGNNPLNITDPSGEAWWHWVIGGAAAALGFPQFFAGAMAAAGGAAIPAVAAAQAAAASAGFGFMVSSSVDAVVNRRPPVIGLFQGGNPSGLFNCGGPFGNCGPSDYPWSEDHPALHRTQLDPTLMIFDVHKNDQIEGLYKHLQKHLDKLRQFPNSTDVNKWKREIRIAANNITKAAQQHTKHMRPDALEKYINKTIGVTLEQLEKWKTLRTPILIMNPCIFGDVAIRHSKACMDGKGGTI